jgi:hypothetical protein
MFSHEIIDKTYRDFSFRRKQIQIFEQKHILKYKCHISKKLRFFP